MNFQTFRIRFSAFACVSTDQVEAAFPGFSRDNYAEWVRHGYLLRLRRGWYAFAEAADVPGVGDYFAGRIYSPSYLSLEYVMARCGLIPESVVQITSATSLKTASFRNAFGEFVYRSVKPELMFGYDAETVGGGLPVLVASPAKALCDFLYLNPRCASAEDLALLRLDEDALEGLFADGSLERTAARFRSRTLAARVALLRETLLP
jgi:predicted transcriptional regulator of viral defense system